MGMILWSSTSGGAPALARHEAERRHHPDDVVMAVQEELLTAGLDAINRADWRSAEELFREAMTLGESAELLDGLATALWWQDQLEEARVLRERAFSTLRARGELGAAAGLGVVGCGHY